MNRQDAIAYAARKRAAYDATPAAGDAAALRAAREERCKVRAREDLAACRRELEALKMRRNAKGWG